jgi:hypothetical protein
MSEEVLKSENDMEEAMYIYRNYIESGKLRGYILGHKYFAMHAGMLSLRDFKGLNKKLDLSNAPMHDFILNANIELCNEDANKIIDDNDNNKTFIFLDPPYIASCNIFYSTDTGENISNIYEKLSSYRLKNYKM